MLQRGSVNVGLHARSVVSAWDPKKTWSFMCVSTLENVLLSACFVAEHLGGRAIWLDIYASIQVNVPITVKCVANALPEQIICPSTSPHTSTALSGEYVTSMLPIFEWNLDLSNNTICFVSYLFMFVVEYKFENLQFRNVYVLWATSELSSCMTFYRTFESNLQRWILLLEAYFCYPVMDVSFAAKCSLVRNVHLM